MSDGWWLIVWPSRDEVVDRAPNERVARRRLDDLIGERGPWKNRRLVVRDPRGTGVLRYEPHSGCVKETDPRFVRRAA